MNHRLTSYEIFGASNYTERRHDPGKLKALLIPSLPKTRHRPIFLIKYRWIIVTRLSQKVAYHVLNVPYRNVVSNRSQSWPKRSPVRHSENPIKHLIRWRERDSIDVDCLDSRFMCPDSCFWYDDLAIGSLNWRSGRNYNVDSKKKRFTKTDSSTLVLLPLYQVLLPY